ncbi:1,4-alpha-glucan branching protein [Streptomyces sp. NPDC006879]|uniref:maltokinase N-terminal cap-like domain-containing protein n=1 Tax=Streptomyces sp. NPDC006879 TaxID=3364767 RepID=UPI0036A68ECE
MAVIHRTTLTPTKLELLAEWIPKQNWYQSGPAEPELARAGGFRLDDPLGEVGIELMVVADTAWPEPVAYLVPLAYRGAALPNAPAEALIGTAEHGVLGTRWIYDGVQDPVVMEQLGALLLGSTTAQHQSESHTADPTVTVSGAGPSDGLHVRVNRVLQPAVAVPAAPAHLVAGWTWPDGTPARAVVAAFEPS